MNNINYIADAVLKMDDFLRDKYDSSDMSKKIWENTYICRQIERRQNGEVFSIQDHIRGVIYSMLSSGIQWQRIEDAIDVKSKRILPIDKLFNDYDPQYILQKYKNNPYELKERIKHLKNESNGEEYKIASVSTKKQMEELVFDNGIIEKLQRWDNMYGIDNYYNTFLQGENKINDLVKKLSEKGNDKFGQMGVALVSEYLKNVGYDIGKPDRHICRILGKDHLGCSNKKNVPVFDAIDIIREIATKLNKKSAEVDYILWSFCASGFGEVCIKTKRKEVKLEKCNLCVVKHICNYPSK